MTNHGPRYARGNIFRYVRRDGSIAYQAFFPIDKVGGYWRKRTKTFNTEQGAQHWLAYMRSQR